MRFKDFYADLDEAQGYQTLWRLRWLEAGALALGATAASTLLNLALPWSIIGALLFTLLLSNAIARPTRAFVRDHLQLWALVLLALDSGLLTLLLYFTGGAHNPLTMLFLPLIVLGVILLPSAAAWSLVLLAILAFSLLFLSPHMLMSRSGEALCHDMDFHLRGMVFGLAASGAIVVYFVSSLNRALRAKHREVEALRKQMTEQRKTAEIGALAATIAHEVATPLGTIAVIGRDLESIECSAACGAQLREDAQLIREAVSRCQKVLLWLSQRSESNAPETAQTISAALFQNQLLAFLNESERTRVRFFTGEGAKRSVHTSLQELVIAAATLIRNGLDASADDDAIELRWEGDAHQVRIVVRDHGHGMAEAILTKAREPFFTTKPPEKGLGLGLYLVTLFCQRQGGALELESSPATGTIATLRLPAAP